MQNKGVGLGWGYMEEVHWVPGQVGYHGNQFPSVRSYGNLSLWWKWASDMAGNWWLVQ